MKKLLLFTWMMMLSIVAMAQTIIVVDKDGNRVPYDPSKIISVEFQNTPPGFSINMDGMSIPYTFEVVKSIQGNPNFVFVDPETVKVNGEGEDLAVHVKADVEFDATTSDSWITFDTEAKDGMCYVKVAMNPSVDERSATVVLKSKDGTLTSTLNVVQAGKEDSRYIDIDWEKDRLDSFDAETGEAVITFANALPIMGEYDVVLLPTEGGGLAIRVINEVAKTEGKTVTLKTEKGDMGNLFRDEKFTLDFDMTGNESTSAKARAAAADGGIPVYYPVSVEEFDGEKFVEIYNAEKPKNRATRASNDDDNWYEYSATGAELYKDANVHLKLKHHLIRLNLRGKTTLEFKKSPWWKVWKGETVEHSLTSEGTIYNEMELECHNFVCEDHTTSLSQHLEDIAIYRVFNFKIGEKKIPLRMRMFCDIDFAYRSRSNGIVDMTAGVKAYSTVKYGYIYKEDNHDEPGSNFECKTVYNNLNEPSLQVADINADQYMEVEASSYPYYRYIFYDGDREFQLQPKQVINVGGYGRKVDNKYSAMNLEATTENKAFLWLEVNKDRYKIDKSVPGTKRIFSMPAALRPSINNYNVRDVIEGDVRELEFNVLDWDWIENYNPSKGAMLVKLTCKNGLFVDMNNADGSSANNAVETYQYIDKNGCVKCKFKQISKEEPGEVIAELIGGNPNMEPIVEKFMLDLHKYEIQCLTPEVEIEKGQTATIEYQINHYWNGELINNNIMPHVEFIAEGGTVSPLEITEEDVRAAEGKLTVTFTPDENATEGKVGAQPTLEYKQMKWLGASIAHITIKGSGGDDDIKDNDLKKAKKLDDNSYVIDDKVTKLDGPEDEMVWTTYEDNEGNKTNSLYWFKEDPVYYTTAWGTIYGFTEDMFGEEIYWSDGSGLSINLGAFIDPSAGYNESNVIEFTSENIEKAVFKLTKNADGSIDALAYVRSKDGKEGAFKVKAKPAPSSAPQRVGSTPNSIRQSILKRITGQD